MCSMEELLQQYQETAQALEGRIREYKRCLADMSEEQGNLQRRLHLATQELGEVRGTIREIAAHLEK